MIRLCTETLADTRDTDTNNRMIDIMATMTDLTLGVKAVVARPATGTKRPAAVQSTWHDHLAQNLARYIDSRNYMQYLDAMKGLRSQDFSKEEVAARRYDLQKFIDGLCNKEKKRNLALMRKKNSLRTHKRWKH